MRPYRMDLIRVAINNDLVIYYIYTDTEISSDPKGDFRWQPAYMPVLKFNFYLWVFRFWNGCYFRENSPIPKEE